MTARKQIRLGLVSRLKHQRDMDPRLGQLPQFRQQASAAVRRRPGAQRMAETRAPAALVGGDLTCEDIQVGQVLGAVLRGGLVAHAARQSAAFTVDGRQQQRLQLCKHPAPQRLDELGVRTAGAPMLMATLGLRAGHVPVLLPWSPSGL